VRYIGLGTVNDTTVYERKGIIGTHERVDNID